MSAGTPPGGGTGPGREGPGSGDRSGLLRTIFLRSARFVSARAVTGGLSVVTSLLLYRALGPEEAGRFQFVLAAGMTLGVVCGLGFLETLARFVPERPAAEGDGLFRRALLLNLVAGLALGLLVRAGVGLTGFPPDIHLAGWLFPLFFLVYALYTTALGMLRGRGRLETLPLLDLGWNFGAKAAALAAAAAAPFFIPAFAAYTAVDLAVVGGALLLLRRYLGGPRRVFSGPEATFARLVLLAEVLRILSRTVDVFVIRGLLGPEATGLFTAGARVTTVVEQLVLTPVGVPLLYYFSHPASASLRRFVVENGTRLLGGLVGFAALALAAAAGPVVTLLLGPEYAGSIPVARLYTGHAVGASLLVMMIPLYHSRNRPQFGIAQALLVFALNLVLDLILVPRFGVMGAAAGGVAATAVAAVVVAWAVRGRLEVDVRSAVVRILGLYLGCFALVAAGRPFVALGLYLVGLGALRLVRRGDLELLRRRAVE